jgi:hypothetical protein
MFELIVDNDDDTALVRDDDDRIVNCCSRLFCSFEEVAIVSLYRCRFAHLTKSVLLLIACDNIEIVPK